MSSPTPQDLPARELRAPSVGAPAPASRAARLGWAAFWGASGQLLSLAVNLWATPKLLLGLGEAHYGSFVLLSALAAYVLYLELGFGSAYTRALGLALARQEMDRAQALYENAHSFYTRLGVVGGLLLVGAGFFFSPSEAPGAREALALWGAWFFCAGLLSARRGVIVASSRVEFVARWSALWQPVVPLAQVAAVLHGGGIAAMAALQLGGLLALDLLLWWRGRDALRGLITRRVSHPELRRDLFRFGVYKFFCQLAPLAQSSGDRLLLGLVAGVPSVAAYALAASVAQRVRALLGAWVWPLGPVLVARVAREGVPGAVALLLAYSRRVGFIAWALAAGAWFLAAPFFSFWLGERYAVPGAVVVSWLVPGAALSTLAALLGTATDALHRPRDFALSSGVVVLVLVVAGLPLALWRGGSGIAISGFLSSAAGLALMFFFAREALGRDALRALFWGALCLPALVGVASWAVMEGASRLFLLIGWQGEPWGWLLAGGAGALVGCLLAVCVGLLPVRFWRGVSAR